jgi:tRNA(His) guanylyltransferase
MRSLRQKQPDTGAGDLGQEAVVCVLMRRWYVQMTSLAHHKGTGHAARSVNRAMVGRQGIPHARCAHRRRPLAMDLADRMKLYEQIGAGQRLIPNLPVCIRLDGKAFHQWTRGLGRPYDDRLHRLFDETTKFLVEVSDAVIGYTQSDEVTLILYNGGQPDAQVFFDGRVAKLTSVLASMATAKFNALVPSILPEKRDRLACFDGRVWTVPSEQEAVNCLIWREWDATRNSIQMAAQALYSHKQLHQKNTSEMQALLWQKGINWQDYPARFTRGGYFQRQVIERTFTVEELAQLPPLHDARKYPDMVIRRQVIVPLELPPLLKVANRVEVIFRGCVPEPVTELRHATYRGMIRRMCPDTTTDAHQLLGNRQPTCRKMVMTYG